MIQLPESVSGDPAGGFYRTAMETPRFKTGLMP